MKATSDVIFRLEQLKDYLLLASKKTNNNEFFHIMENEIYSLVGWKIENFKPLLGKAYDKLTEIQIKDAKNLGTIYVGVWNSNLEMIIDKMERDRKNMMKISKELNKFKFEIRKIEEVVKKEE